MLKTCLFIILVVFMMPAFAASFMSHEKFVHLSYQEQRKIVIATMELIVEIEAKYKHEVKTSGFDPERFRRYSEFMRSVSSLFFPEAHAAAVRNQRYGQYLNQLTTILNERNRCLYGGWVSEMSGNKCIHPNRSRFRSIYQTESGCTGNVNEITCNPAIFGFKNVARKTLFCVPAGANQADNTSRDCMVKALAEPAEAGASSREQRIADIIEGIGRNPNDSNAIFNFLIKACACDASKSPQISQHYSNYMRPHQTCYSILKMMSEFTPQCQVSNQPLMDANQTQFLSAIRGIISDTEARSSDVRTTYTTRINDLRTNNAEFRAAETAVCGGPQGAQTGGDTTVIADQCVNRQNSQGEFCCEAGRIPNEARNDCIDDPNDNDESVTVDNNPDGTTGGTSSGTTAGTTGGTTAGTSGGTTEGSTGGTTSGTTGGTTEGTSGGTTSGTTGGTSDTPTECTPPEEGKEFIGGECRPKCNADTEERDPADFSCKCKHGDRPEGEGAQCPAAPDSEGDADSSITLNFTKTNKDSNTTNIKVTLNPAETAKTQFTLIWFSRGSKRPSTFPGSTPATRTTPEYTPIPDSSDATTDDQPTSEADPAPDSTVRNPGDSETSLGMEDDYDVDAPRQTDEYQLCARLIKKSDNSLAAEKCEKIPPKPGVAPRNGGGNPFQQPQMGPTRGGPSDAIFRGIR